MTEAINTHKEMLGSSSVSFSLPDGGGLGGVTTWTIQMADMLAAKGRRVNLLKHKHPYAKPFTCSGKVVVHEVGGGSPYHVRRHYVDEYVKSYGALTPTVFVPNGSPGCYAACAALLNEKSADIRIIAMAHSDEEEVYELLEYYEPIIHCFIAVSIEIADKLYTRLPPERKNDVWVRPCPVDIPKLLKREYTCEGRPLRIVYAGRLQEFQKRFSDVLRVAERLIKEKSNFILDVYGDASEEDMKHYHKQLTSLSVSLSNRIIFHGAIEHLDMLKVWSWADICLMTSAYEGTSISMLEAMAHGVVPVVTRVSGIRETVTNETGFARDVGDVDGLAKDIACLVKNRKVLKVMGEAAHQKVLTLCNRNDYILWFDNLIEKVWSCEPREWPAGKDVIGLPSSLVKSGFSPDLDAVPQNTMKSTFLRYLSYVKRCVSCFLREYK